MVASPTPRTNAKRSTDSWNSRLCSRYSRDSSTTGSMTCVVNVGDFRVSLTPMSRLTCPNQTGWPSQRNGASHRRMWLRCEMVLRPRCSARSCLRPNACSELTGAVSIDFSAMAAPTMRRMLSAVIASVYDQPLALSAAMPVSPVPTSTTLSGSPSAVPSALVVQQGSSRRRWRSSSTLRSGKPSTCE